MAWNILTRLKKQPSHTERPDSTPAATPTDPKAPAQADSEHVFVARQPIFTDTEQVAGYALFSPDCPDDLETASSVRCRNSARLIIDVLANFGLDKVVGDKMAFLPIAQSTLASNGLSVLPLHKVVLEITPSVVPEKQLNTFCEALQEKCYRYSLNGFALNDQTEEAFLGAHCAAFDVRDGVEQAIQAAMALSHLPLKRIAWNIESRQEFEACRAAFDLFHGNVFARPEAWSMNRVDPSNLRVVQVFNLVMNRADLDEIEDAFKHDVGLSYSLLTFINSAGVGLPYKTHSIRHALMQLGYDYLARWLALLIFAGVDIRAAQRVLLNTALIRARLTELLGNEVYKRKEADQLFIVGMFSMLDTLLGIPLEEILSKLNLPQDITDALLHKSGKYRPYLELALSFEGKDLARAERLCQQLNLDLSAASYAHLAAIEWARQMG